MFDFEPTWGGCKRYIVLDSNILYKDPWLSGAGFRTLRSILTLFEAQVLLPNVVIEETVNNFRKSLVETLNKSQRLDELLNRRLIARVRNRSEDLVIRYRQFLTSQFLPQVLDNPGPPLFARLPYPEIAHSQVVSRLIAPKRPFHGDDRGYRDFLIWLSLVDVAKECPGTKITFVSENVKDFCSSGDEGKSLHPDLLADLPPGAQVVFYSKLAELLASLLGELPSEARDFLQKHPNLIEKLERDVVPQLLDRWLATVLAPDWGDGRVYAPLGASNVVVELRQVTSMPDGTTTLLLDASYWPKWYYEDPSDMVLDNSETVAVTLQLRYGLEVVAADIEGNPVDLP